MQHEAIFGRVFRVLRRYIAILNILNECGNTIRAMDIPLPAVPIIPRIEEIKALGVTISRKFSAAQHINHLLVSCAQLLFALRTLRHHGLPTRWGPVHTTSLSQFELLHSVTIISSTECYIKTLVAFDNIVIYIFHVNLTVILCISVLTVKFIKLLLTYFNTPQYL